MKVNIKERVGELIQNNKALSYSGMYLYLRTLVLNSKDTLES